jgi:diguanylate cyclase (GGDEF)-like protein/putative nucleotidyltransferase with HDIG domain
MKDLSRKARVYIVVTYLCGLLVLGLNLPRLNLSDPWMLLSLSILASLSLIFKVEGATDRLHYNISFLIYSFTFILLGVADTILVILISNLVEWTWHKYPWYIQIFNIASYLVVMHISGMVYEFINPEMTVFSLAGILGTLLAVLLFTFLNHFMVGLVVWLARGESFIKSGVFDVLPLMIDFTLLAMGVGAALIWMINPYGIVYSVLPLYLIYSTLKVPALERQSEMDSKTGLYNAKYFSNALTKELERANRFDRPLTVVMGDLDLLRNINNSYGHLAGDEVLIGVAKILMESVREYDIVSRFGGEEFAILIPETQPEEVIEHIEGLRNLIEDADFTVPTSVTPIQVTMSFGIAGRQGFNQSPGDIVHNADTALYYAKLKGRNRVYVYSDEGFEALLESEVSNDPTLRKHSMQERLKATEYGFIPNPLRNRHLGKSDDETLPIEAVGVHKSYPGWVIYLFIGVLAAVSLIWYVILDAHAPSPDWIGLLMFTGMVILTEALSIDIYVRNTSVSTSAAPMLGGILLFGPKGALIVGLTFAVVSKIKHHSPISRGIFNASNQIVAGLTYLTLLNLLSDSFFLDLSTPIQVLVTLAAAGITYFITTYLIAVAMHITHNLSIKKVWNEQFGWLAPHYFSMGVIAFALIFSYVTASIIGLITLLIPLFLVRFSQMQFIDRTRSIVQELREKNVALGSNSEEIYRLNENLFEALAEVIDLRDPYVMGHSKHVARYAVMISQELGLPPERNELVEKAALLHDIGKLGIPDKILQKPGKLDEDEYKVMQSHTTLGSGLLRTSQKLRNLIPIIRHHHEWYDGNGYPDGLRGKDIPLEARIVALADAVEAMASDRPYRRARTPEEIFEEIKGAAGTQFDPDIVRAFIDAVKSHPEMHIINAGRNLLIKKENNYIGIALGEISED